jgi:uncharacterized membrane protein YhaH (DUF805 family)
VRFMDLWRWHGRVDRKTFAAVGVFSFMLKRFLDFLITVHFLNKNAGISLNYWEPLGIPVSIDHLSLYQINFLAALVFVALPFIWLGMAMTVKRLRDAGGPVWLAVIFFIPVANVLFLAGLCFAPTKDEPETPRKEAAPWPGPRLLDKIIPRGREASALFGVVVASVVGLGFMALGTSFLQTYGWGLFIALPFCLGLLSVLCHCYYEPRAFGECMGVAMLPLVVVGIALMMIAMEGIICIVMAAPVAAFLAVLGGMLGYTIQSSYWMSRHSSSTMCAILLVLPAIFGAEHAAKLEPPRFVVKTAIEINAPPETVWKQVIAFSEIAPPTELLFRAGIAYPVRAEITGHGPGAVRHCVFSTGPFVEPIEVWDEPRLLSFGVTSTPAPMNELTPYGHIDPQHLHGYFVSEHGQFALTELPGGRTRLEGTTSYRNAIWPGQYWRLWSDYIIHRVHTRVLEHIKMEVETGKPAPQG